jgi:hypothetical protein
VGGEPCRGGSGDVYGGIEREIWTEPSKMRREVIADTEVGLGEELPSRDQ